MHRVNTTLVCDYEVNDATARRHGNVAASRFVDVLISNFCFSYTLGDLDGRGLQPLRTNNRADKTHDRDEVGTKGADVREGNKRQLDTKNCLRVGSE
jgi:hypothetical protein